MPELCDQGYRSPLLTSAWHILQELEYARDNAASTMGQLRDHVASIARENEDLRKELANALDAAALRVGDTDMGALPEHGTDAPLLAREAELLRAEVSELQTENSQLHEAITAREDLLDAHSSQLENAQAALAKAQEAITSLTSDKSAAESHSQDLAQQLAGAQTTLHRTAAELKTAHADCAELQDKVTEYKAAISELYGSANAESDMMAKRLQQLEQRNRELQRKLEVRNNALSEAQEALQEAQGEASTTRADCEGMMQVMASLERQLASARAREQDVDNREAAAEDLTAAAAMERDAALAREASARRELARVLERRRTDLATAAQAEEAAVAEAKERAGLQLASVEAELKVAMERVAQAETQAARMQRETGSLQAQLSAAKGALDKERATASKVVEDLNAQMAAAEKAAVESRAAAEDAKSQADTLCSDAARDRERLTEELSEARTAADAAEQAAKDAVTAMQDAVRRSQAAEESALQAREAEQAAKLAGEWEAAAAQAAAEREVRTWRARVEDLLTDNRALQSQAEKLQLARRTDASMQATQLAEALQHAQRRVVVATGEAETARAHAAELAREVEALRAAAAQADSARAEAQESASHLRIQLDDASRGEASSAGQLAELVSREQRRIQRVAALERRVAQLQQEADHAVSLNATARETLEEAHALHVRLLNAVRSAGGRVPPEASAFEAVIPAVLPLLASTRGSAPAAQLQDKPGSLPEMSESADDLAEAQARWEARGRATYLAAMSQPARGTGAAAAESKQDSPAGAPAIAAVSGPLRDTSAAHVEVASPEQPARHHAGVRGATQSSPVLETDVIGPGGSPVPQRSLSARKPPTSGSSAGGEYSENFSDEDSEITV